MSFHWCGTCVRGCKIFDDKSWCSLLLYFIVPLVGQNMIHILMSSISWTIKYELLKKKLTFVAVIIDLDVNCIQSAQRRASLWRVIIQDRCVLEWSGGLWELVSVQFLCSAHILRVNPCPLGQLGGTVSCLKSSQFTGPFKVSTPTRGPQDHKTTNTGLSRPPIWDTQMHTCMHACTLTHQLLTAHLSLMQRRG